MQTWYTVAPRAGSPSGAGPGGDTGDACATAGGATNRSNQTQLQYSFAKRVPLLSRLEQARDWLQRACALEPDEPDVRYNAACALAALGDHDRALDLLEQLSEGEADAYRSWMEHDAWLDPLRGHERFQRLFNPAPGAGSNESDRPH